jgi:hypothetical protein
MRQKNEIDDDDDDDDQVFITYSKIGEWKKREKCGNEDDRSSLKWVLKCECSLCWKLNKMER